MKKKFGNKIIYIFILICIVCVIWAILRYCEWQKPVITLDKSIKVIGVQKNIKIKFEDKGCGLRTINVSITQDGVKHSLLSEVIPNKGLVNKEVVVSVVPGKLNLKNKAASIFIAATDYSLLKNKKIINLDVMVDYTPPVVSLISVQNNINPGGACLAVYNVSEEVSVHGVKCGSDFYKGYKNNINNKSLYLCLFAIPQEITKESRFLVEAVDAGNNKTDVNLPFYIRKTSSFKSDKVNLGDNFLNNIAVQFPSSAEPALAGKSPVEIFEYVNTVMRQNNTRKIQEICRKTEPGPLWNGLFLRMSNAAPMAAYGDRRTYVYNGKAIGESIHLGIDLASTANAPVQAANNGIILYAGRLGIYGNMVIIDHGLGLASLYGHMNSISVKAGQRVEKGAVIGNSGATGLAGGDHLHFSILVSGSFVNPVEWWDPHWIKDNIDKKLAQATGQ